MLTFEPRQRRRRRTEHATLAFLVRCIQLFAQLETIRPHPPEVWSMDQQARERDERRIRMILTIPQLLFVERFVVLRTRVAQSIMIRIIRLNEHSSRSIATPRSSGNLRDELKRSFRRAKVRQRETDVH